MTKAEAYEKAWRIAFKNNDFSLADEIYHPEYSQLNTSEALENSLTPIYPTTAGVSQSAVMVCRQLMADIGKEFKLIQ